jgi:sugar phosphate isomerase/epimerase
MNSFRLPSFHPRLCVTDPHAGYNFKRRDFIIALPSLAMARSILGAADGNRSGLGICNFSCHRHWSAVRDNSAPTQFRDCQSFYKYVRTLGAEGVQTSSASLTVEQARALRDHVETTRGYYEADIQLPRSEGDLAKFEADIRIATEAGAKLARACLSGTRRYETWKTLDAFQSFREQSSTRLKWIEPILKKNRFKIAIENHKDLTCVELARLMREISSEWIGVNVDTGNNLALLDDPYEAVKTLAPFALSVHLKDMAVQPDPRGFLLSEVPCGTGFLDLVRMATTLRQANPSIYFNLEMATRDPLVIPCANDSYWATFPERRATHLDPGLSLVKDHPITSPPPSVQGKSILDQMDDEEKNNITSLKWMHSQLVLCPP